jgi:hypothetical protein
VQPSENEQIVVAYDGTSKGALLIAENLAKNTGRNLKAITVLSDEEDKTKLHLLTEEGQSYLREYWTNNVFSVHEGRPAKTLIANVSNKTLLVLGNYGYIASK